MKKVLFFIHNMEDGGAQKVLTKLVNAMDPSRFELTVISLFGHGVNERFLKDSVRYRYVFPYSFRGNRVLQKLFSPNVLHRFCIREHYDIEISYLEGISARIISGCPDPSTKLVSWIHVEQHTMDRLAQSFRSAEEASACYNRFDQSVCVSRYVMDDFCGILNFQKPCCVLYNTVDSEEIRRLARENPPSLKEFPGHRLIAVGTLKQSKGYERLFHIIKRLKEDGYPVFLNVLGVGPLQKNLETYLETNDLQDSVALLGYDTNPYQYVARSDLFVCSSFAEGFSTAATEALIVGTPVCTVEVSGMKEMLGDKDEYGIVTENNEDALYEGIRKLLDDPALLAHYREQARLRGGDFSTEKTAKAVQEMLLSLRKDCK